MAASTVVSGGMNVWASGSESPSSCRDADTRRAAMARVVSGNGLGGQNGLIGKEGNGPGVVGLGIEGGRVVDEGARVADGRGVGARGDGHIRPELFGPLLGVGRGSLGVLG